jgi:Fuc2NAc and GlcNAc transferase
LLSLPFLVESGLLAWRHGASLFGAGLIVAILGFLDDHGHIAARWRLLGHFAAALWMLIFLGGVPPVTLFGTTFDPGWLGCVLSLLYLVWLLNLYNFMDGINGIASIEAIFACLAACVLYIVNGSSSLVFAPMFLACSVLGFLLWNFPVARIFMGDAGSGFLGIVLGGLSLIAAWASTDLFWGWLILLGIFIVDSTFTLIRRLIRGEKIYEAHRSHAYQFAAMHYQSHVRVSLGVFVINLIWLLPLAIAVVAQGLNGPLAVLIAYTPLVGIAVKFRAGQVEHSS